MDEVVVEDAVVEEPFEEDPIVDEEPIEEETIQEEVSKLPKLTHLCIFLTDYCWSKLLMFHCCIMCRHKMFPIFNIHPLICTGVTAKTLSFLSQRCDLLSDNLFDFLR